MFSSAVSLMRVSSCIRNVHPRSFATRMAARHFGLHVRQ